MSLISRRHAHQAGESWRKWGDPLMYGAQAPEGRWERRGRVFLLWLTCIDVGALAALVVGR